MSSREKLKAYLVGGGISSLGAAAYLIRDGHVLGKNIHILSQSDPGGSLDASGCVEHGFSMRGSRMLGASYALTYDLLSGVPSLDDPEKSVSQDTLEFSQSTPWNDQARLIENGNVVDASSWGLSDKDRVDLIRLILRAEHELSARRIDECFEPHFFETNFWLMWSSMFGFETWHSATELRRYLVRFLRLFPDLENLRVIQSTRYNSYDSIVRPLVRWLEGHSVHLDAGVEVIDLELTCVNGKKSVNRIVCLRGDEKSSIHVAEGDLVIVTIGSMTEASSRGSMTSAPVLDTERTEGPWALWRRLAEKDPVFGRPSTFCEHVDSTMWVTFTVTDSDETFVKLMEGLSSSRPGRGGLVTLKGSSWRLTFHLYHPPAYAKQPEGVHVWWGYGLFPDRVGNHVRKKMSESSGGEILVEVYSHLGFQAHITDLLKTAICVPCILPYATSQFMPRAEGDRPEVVPAETENLALIGQYCEIPDDVVYTMEYSVHSARLAVGSLLGFADEIPPTRKGLEDRDSLISAMERIVR